MIWYLLQVVIVLSIFSSHIQELPHYNRRMLTDMHDFRVLTSNAVGGREIPPTPAGLFEAAGCFERSVHDTVVVPHYAASTVSPTCACLAHKLYNRTLQSTGELYRLHPPINITSDRYKSIGSSCMWEKLLTVTHETDLSTNIFVASLLLNFVSQLHVHAVFKFSSALELSATFLCLIWHITLIFLILDGGNGVLMLLVMGIFVSLYVIVNTIAKRYVVTSDPKLSRTAQQATAMTQLAQHPYYLYTYLCTFVCCVPITVYMYNISHFHMDLGYNIISIMMACTIALSCATSIVYACMVQRRTTTLHSNTLGSILSTCITIMLAAMYAMIPPSHLLYPQTQTAHATTWGMVLLLLFTLVSVAAPRDRVYMALTLRIMQYLGALVPFAIQVTVLYDMFNPPQHF
jgi:hypothetical protein